MDWNHQRKKSKQESLLAANHLLLIVFPCQSHQWGLNDSSSQSQYQVQGRLCRNPSPALYQHNLEQHKILLQVFGSTSATKDWVVIHSSLKQLDLGHCFSNSREVQTKYRNQHGYWRTFLDIVVSQSAPILELFAGEYETLLVRGNSCKQLCQRNQVLKP